MLASDAIAQSEKIVVDGSTTVGPIAKQFAEHMRNLRPSLNITVSESGSGNGAKSLINRVCDVADMSRFMKDKEFKAAVEKGVMPVAHVIAMDGIAVVVHPSNAVEDLELSQIRDIYMGKITNWREVGGPNQRIVMISRDTNSGTYETFEGLVMQKEKIAPQAEYVGSNGQARQRVMSTPGAIAYVGLGFISGVKAVKVNGVEATKANVASGRYPISRPLYMFTDGFPKLGSPVHEFVTLHLTAEGQEIIESIGFVPVTQYPAGYRLVEDKEKNRE
jgi:phosphate transport system substrate-binding protein